MSRRVAGLLAKLALHPVNDPLERQHLQSVQSLLSSTTDPFSRDQYVPGHITASSYVLDHAMQHVLLIYHSKLHRWLQPGGHVEAGDYDIEFAARREVQEETALFDLELLGSGVLDVDVHEIPARGDTPAHQHYDVRLLFRSRSGSAEAGSDAEAVRWVGLGEVDGVETDESVMRAVRKIRQRVEGAEGVAWLAGQMESQITRISPRPWLAPGLAALLRQADAAGEVGLPLEVSVDGARAGVLSSPDSAIPSWVAAELAGRDLLESGASDRARIVFEDALQEAPLEAVAQRAWLCGLLAQARMVDGQFERSHRAWREALELSLQAGLPADADLCRLGLATCCAHQGQRAEARAWAQSVLDGDGCATARYRAAEQLLMLGGRWGAYREAVVSSLSDHEWWGRRLQHAQAWERAARLAGDYGQVEDTDVWWGEAFDGFARSGDAERAHAAQMAQWRLRHRASDDAEGTGFYGMLWRAERSVREGDGLAAQRVAYRALALAEEQENVAWGLEANALLATIRLYRGDPADALPRYERCRRAHADALHTVGESLMCSMVVASEMLLGRVKEATQRSMEVRGHPDALYAVRLAGYAEQIVALGALDALERRERRPLGPLGYSDRLEVSVLACLVKSLKDAR